METLRLGTKKVVTVVCRGPPADNRDDEPDRVDDAPELDLLDDVDVWGDGPQRVRDLAHAERPLGHPTAYQRAT